ncbi:aminotransferase class I/II-fold pyridoxal phosphate-dependent enzyme [Chitinophaga barathri]|uniref:Pyridoxal phosphate-dependent aminotransferase family protein n=1 Tax=Chitinophaga barathri TaxID=1647451 RepID=A0A3N4M557_9BACT|nr:aminotransferase class I/II-fold pyridoxal phosphate-dependent enzyme [Chitinophaga barathri]RPD38344.1 pyridoxal phosphate-dependent aminotransferase family protein [Chitinophaga barathri]
MFSITDSTPGRTAQIEGRSCLFFSGFAYLGMHVSHAFRDLLAEGLERYGSVYPSSRIGNLQLRLYEELEHALAAQLHQQSAACFSSGYLAAQAAVTYAVSKGEALYSPGAHPAIRYPGAQIPAGSWAAWIDTVVDMVNLGEDHQYVIIADAVNPLTATINDFSALKGLKRKTFVLIDDSHGLGILGPEGEGIISLLPANEGIRYLITASLAKAYSLEGGMVAGHAGDIAAIRKLPLFTASTTMIPAYAHAFLKAQSAFANARKRLQKNILTMEGLTAGIAAISHQPSLPVFVLEDREEDVNEYLLGRDTIISSFAYPDPQGPKIHRVVLSALHTRADIEILMVQLVQFYTQL